MAKYVVCHPSLYLRVDGKVQQMAMGAELNLAGDVADGLVRKGFIKLIPQKAKKKPIDKKE